jgi:epoxyqueuosine reductase
MSNSQFRKRFGHISGAWRGRNPIQRNAIIAAGNLRDPETLPELIRVLEKDDRPVLRGAAAWALGRIGLYEGICALEAALKREKHPEVLEEVRESLLNYPLANLE